MLSGISMLKIDQIKDVYNGVTTLWNCSFCFNITMYEGGLETYVHKLISEIVTTLYTETCHQYAILFVPSWMNYISFE
jgi:hypothetical protein